MKLLAFIFIILKIIQQSKLNVVNNWEHYLENIYTLIEEDTIPVIPSSLVAYYQTILNRRLKA